MPARNSPDPNSKTRLERVTEIARESECDEDEATFKEKLGQIARHKPHTFTHDQGTPDLEHIAYRSWRIDLMHHGSGWKAFIYSPGSILAEPAIPNDQDPGSRIRVIDEAKRYIDAAGS